MSDRVLVTGADGFVGTRLVAELHRENYDVLTHTLADGDIARCPLPFQGVQRVVHLAARTFVPESWESPRDFYETNLLGTVNVLEFCRRQQASLVLMSSYVYGRPQWLPIGEDHPLAAFNPYGHSKILAEEAARYFATQFGLRIATIRPFNIYGPGQGSQFLIPTLLRQALDPGSDAITVADSRPKRDHLHVDDLVSLLVLVVKGGAAGVYNAGSGRSVSIAELVDLINRSAPRPKPLVSMDRTRADDVLDTVADCRKAERELGWTPRVALADGIGELVRAAVSGQPAPARP
ncbi:MAG TPA: NAD(P)-dependent oxidoreductase [Bryobacteraceae bacterium]|nr:NAD(P)-dependent oxidoreductase [Bryobacteraceae bacterium]